MTFFKIAVLVVMLAVVAHAMPKYVAIPIEDMEKFGLVARPVYTRQARLQEGDYEPIGAESGAEREYATAPAYQAEDERPKRHSAYGAPSGNDHVDYGAYTGGYGAFGWYTDHPVGYGH